MDLESLSKEELIRMLRGNNTQSIVYNQERRMCKFIPKKGELTPCLDQSCTTFGFCNKHKHTVQARQAELLFAKEQMEKRIIESVNGGNNVQEESTKPPEPSSNETKPIEESVPPIEEFPKKRIIKQNKWGRFEDLETGIIFDPTTKTAFGVQNRKTGGLMMLDDEKILLCQERGWRYKLFDVNKPIKKKKPVKVKESSSDSEAESKEENDKVVKPKKKKEKVETKKSVQKQSSSESEEETPKKKHNSEKKYKQVLVEEESTEDDEDSEAEEEILSEDE
jgi:hypothetical protein